MERKLFFPILVQSFEKRLGYKVHGCDFYDAEKDLNGYFGYHNGSESAAVIDHEGDGSKTQFKAYGREYECKGDSFEGQLFFVE